MNLKAVLQDKSFKVLLSELFRGKEIDFVSRPASFVFKLKKEPTAEGSIQNRVIVLPPGGCTANKSNELSSHPEVRQAKILIKGALRLGKKGFSLTKNIVKHIFFVGSHPRMVGNMPYARTMKGGGYRETIRSSKDKFLVVKKSGEGFYHNLINVSGEWVVLVLEKEVKKQRTFDPNFEAFNLSQNERRTLTQLVSIINKKGDRMFNETGGTRVIDKLLHRKVSGVLSALISALNISEAGKHEQCTVFALILKLSRKDRSAARKILEAALESGSAPSYYLKELISKLA